MFDAFENTLKKHNRPYILLEGNKETRLQNAVKAIDLLIANRKNLTSFSKSLGK